MVLIRKEQWAAFEGDVLARLADKLAPDMARAYPGPCAKLGSRAEVVKVVQEALERAVARGITEQPLQVRWVHLTFTLGPAFDESPRYPWAAQVMAWDEPAKTKLDALERTVQEQIVKRALGGS